MNLKNQLFLVNKIEESTWLKLTTYIFKMDSLINSHVVLVKESV